MSPILHRIGRVLGWFVTVVLGIVALAAIAVVVLTGTNWGRSRVRTIALGQLGNLVHGQVSLGRIEGNLLTGITVHDLSIRDSTGAPFLAAEQLSAHYAIGTLIGKKIWLNGVRLVRPTIVLDREPGRLWNYQYIFPQSANKTPSTTPGFGSWIRFEDVTVVDGHLIVLSPWHPDSTLGPEAQDSVVRAALGGKSRLIVVRAAGAAPGLPPYQKVVELRTVNARLPMLLLADPNQKNRVAEVASLQMTALPFRPPGAVVTNMVGTFPFNNDSLWWHSVQASMPASRVGGDGSYVFNSGDMMLSLRGAPAALADLRWLYPRLPSEGAGTLDFFMRWKQGIEDYTARNADVQVGDTRIQGSFGLTLSDTFALHDTDLQFANFDTRLAEQLIAGFTSPVRGSLSGHAAVNGGKHAMQVDADLAFANLQTGTSRVAAAGNLGMLDEGGMRANDLRLQLHPVQVALAKAVIASRSASPPSIPVSGVVTGTAFVNGTTRSQLVAVLDVSHDDAGNHSHLNGRTAVRLAQGGGAPWLDVNVVARPVSLAEVGRFVPSVQLQGSATGPIQLTGTLANLRVASTLALPDGGQMVARGTLGLAGSTKSYDLALGLKVFNLHSVMAKGPTTSLTLVAAGKGAGFSPATMHGAFATDFSASRFDSLALDTGTVRVAIANGVATVQRLQLEGQHTVVRAQGGFGLAAGRTGTLTYQVAIDSLGALDRLLPHAGPDTGVVRPRPAVIARAVRRARADSMRIARQTEVERLATGRPMPRLVVDTPKAVPNVVRGSLYAAGTLSGNLQRFDLRGRVAGRNVDVHGNAAQRIQAVYAWTNARTPASTMAVAVQGDSVSAAGFAFDSLDARLSYRAPGGRVEATVVQGGNRFYGLKGDYAINAGGKELRLADLQLRLDSTTWQSTHPSVVYWRPQGLEVHDFELRNGSTGRIYANGLLPTSGSANLTLAVDNLEIGNVLDVLQSDVDLHGLATLHATVHGTLASPTFRGALGLVGGVYNGTEVPELHGTFDYAARRLVSHVDLLRNGGAPMAVADAQLPVNLALQGVTGPRLLNRPLTLDLVADSLPLELIPQFTGAVSNVHGLAAGRVAMRGTFDRPSLAGALLLQHGTVTIAASGMTVKNLYGSVRMLHDTVYVDSLAGNARGDISLRGSLAVGNWREPSFDLYFIARRAEMLNNDRGRVDADAGLRLTGPFTHAYLSGNVQVTGGVIYAPEATGRHVISNSDPGLFAVVDTSLETNRQLFPAESPLVTGLRMEVTLGVSRDTWVRNQEANVEIFTEYPLQVRMRRSQIALTGAVATERGEYDFMSKRFLVTRGSATFVGTEELNPSLQVTGDYQVQMAGAPAMNIQVLIGGTLRRPKLTLASDAQPPRSQSELLSLLAFGRSSSTLLEPQGNSLATVGGSGGLVGLGAALAMNRLTGVAFGVLVQQVQTEVGKGLGADQFYITPGDVPELTNLAGGANFNSFLNDTRIEAGKYLNARTFLGLQEYGGRPGGRIEYRTPAGWIYTGYAEPRIVLQPPTLATQDYKTPSSFGALIVRQWKF